METIGVCIVTYNEEKYVSQAIDSVLAQKCSSEIHLYIGQDASTDGTGDICKRYAAEHPDQITLITQTQNKGLVANTKDVLERIVSDGCEYVAMLDGDDFWTDELKLQKQLTFLQNHPDYGFVHTNQRILYNDTFYKDDIRVDAVSGDLWNIAGQKGTAIANCTAFFRTELLRYCNMQDFIDYGFKSADYPMYIIFMKHAKFQFLPDVTAVWRRGHCSVSGGGSEEKQIAFLENGIQMWKYLAHLFPDKWTYSEKNGDTWRRIMKFKIAFRYGDYELANEMVRKGFYTEQDSLSQKLKRLCARNRLLFTIIYNLKYKRKVY